MEEPSVVAEDPPRIGLGAAVILPIVAVLSLWGMVPPASFSGGASHLAGTGGCAPRSPTPPASLLIPSPAPQGTLPFGSSIGVSFEAALGPTPTPLGNTSVFVPSTTATLPLVGGSTLQVHFSPRWLTLPGTGWSLPQTAVRSISTGVTFSGGNATLSSGWEAVMANASYGAFPVQFQWQWTTVSSSGSSSAGPWSPPVQVSNGLEQPTTLYPAPYVRGVPTVPVGLAEAAGTNFSVGLTGNVSSTDFRILTETATGTETNSVCLLTPPSGTSYLAAIPLRYSDGTPLRAGHYVVHVHNAGGAIVLFGQVNVTSAVSMSIRSIPLDLESAAT